MRKRADGAEPRDAGDANVDKLPISKTRARHACLPPRKVEIAITIIAALKY